MYSLYVQKRQQKRTTTNDFSLNDLQMSNCSLSFNRNVLIIFISYGPREREIVTWTHMSNVDERKGDGHTKQFHTSDATQQTIQIWCLLCETHSKNGSIYECRTKVHSRHKAWIKRRGKIEFKCMINYKWILLLFDSTLWCCWICDTYTCVTGNCLRPHVGR